MAKHEPHLLRARDGYRDFAEGCANLCDEEGEGGNMNPWGWHDELTEADWEMIEKAPLKPAARAILEEYRKDGAQALKGDEFWPWLIEQEVSKLPMSAEELSFGLRKMIKGPGVYLGVGLLIKLLRATYVGKSDWVLGRVDQHWTNIFSADPKSTTLLLQTLAGCDEVAWLLLWEPEDGMDPILAARLMSLFEGIFCQLFGSYTRKKLYLEHRAMHGQKGLGNDVIGGNGE